ncbi:MAG: alpha/beta hydrolase [Dietzia sp.]
MSPEQRAETLVVALDHAEARAAAVGRETADTAADLDSVARRFGGDTGSERGAAAEGGTGAAAGDGWFGHAGAQARRRVGDAAAEAGMVSGACLYLADVLRVEGSRLARALISWADDERVRPGGGDVTSVADADLALTLRLREAADSLAGYTDAATVACIDLSGSTGDDPRVIADLWHSLGPAERERLARDNPELGSVAGVSAATRDAINRTRLRRLLEAGGAPGLAALSAHLAEDPGRHLLSLHPDGRAVVASGDPDGADSVVTLIPGTGSSVESIDRTADRARAVCEASAAPAAAAGDPAGGGADPPTDPSTDLSTDLSTGSCVSVSWQGYDAPDDVAAAGFSAASARAHAQDLRTFAAGLDAVERMDGRDSPHTAVGYSYGSAVLGASAADPHGLAADRMIHVGSPGATVGSLAEQWVDEGGTARQAAEHEVVGVTSRWDPVPWWSTTGVLGGRPGTEEFGGLAVDVTEPGSGPGSTRGAHSVYFDRGTVSLEEIGRLVAGRD